LLFLPVQRIGCAHELEVRIMEILVLIVVGLVAGLLASYAVGGVGFGLLGDIIVGILGAFIGGWLFRALGASAVFPGIVGSIFVAFVGAAVLLLVLRLIRSATHRTRAV
jgi:uncharacterized membrane protein YeaQ/YmgE (transglycosylase-associated protein family)